MLLELFLVPEYIFTTLKLIIKLTMKLSRLKRFIIVGKEETQLSKWPIRNREANAV